MATTLDDGEFIKISGMDTRILLALLKGPMGSYEIGRQCEKDTGLPVTHGTLYPSLKRLERMYFVNKAAGSGKNAHVYRISSLGRQVLEWEIGSMKRMTKLFTERTKKPRR